jgi:type I restriction enzyme S subunit
VNRVVKRDGLFSGTATVANGVAGVAIPERRYANMRPSGVAWLGDVPEHWRTKPLRFACRLNPTKGEISHLPPDTEVSFVPMEAVREFGGMDLAQTKPIESVLQGYTYFRDGDVVVAKITPCFENGKGSIAAGLTNGLGFGTTELHTLRPRPELDRQFLFYLTLSHEFRQQGAGQMYGAGGQKRVPESFLRDFVAPLPPLPEQQAIARWLDERTRRIDDLVAAKRRLLGLLAEQRTALITHAVTKGFNPHAPMKTSGIDWLGSVPAHWEVKQLKFAAMFQRGHDLPLDERIPGDVPIVTSAGPSAWHIQAAAHGPAIVTGRYGTVGEFFLIDGPYWPLNTTLYTIDLRGNETRYLWYMLHALKQVFLMEAGKSAVPGVDRNDLHPIPVVVPPLPEQHAIVTHLDAACAKLDALTATTETAIARLTEYRQAIISAAVTGQVDVRERTA